MKRTYQPHNLSRPRLPREDGDQGRPQDHPESSTQGPQAPRGRHLAEVAAFSVPERPSPERFGKDRRLLKRREYLRVQRQSRGMAGRHVTLLAFLRADADPARLGVTASRKVGNAVERNRARRRVREWFRRHEPLPSGVDLVVILRSGAADVPFGELCTDLDGALARALRQVRRRGPNAPAGA
jgi:ribonuclease P protein component